MLHICYYHPLLIGPMSFLETLLSSLGIIQHLSCHQWLIKHISHLYITFILLGGEKSAWYHSLG